MWAIYDVIKSRIYFSVNIQHCLPIVLNIVFWAWYFTWNRCMSITDCWLICRKMLVYILYYNNYIFQIIYFYSMDVVIICVIFNYIANCWDSFIHSKAWEFEYKIFSLNVRNVILDDSEEIGFKQIGIFLMSESLWRRIK